MRVALFVTCVNDTLFPGTGQAVVTLLRRLGCDVDFPTAQTCCGQMHVNTGYLAEGRRLARHFADVFAGYDAVVVPSGSCAAMVREQYPKLARAASGGHGGHAAPGGHGGHGTGGGPVPSGAAGGYEPRAGEPAPPAAESAEAGPRVYELSEFLLDVLGAEDVGAYFPHRVTYHPTCHSLRGLRLGDRPIRLLERVRGLELVPLPESEECCGFGGTFAVKNPAVSAAMCADKVRNIMDTGAEVVCATDNSCLMHIGGTLRRQRTGVRTMHLAEILAATEDPARTAAAGAARGVAEDAATAAGKDGAVTGEDDATTGGAAR
ncbi:(Fe-S)-binding protein [Streptosporangium pseudovulgare]|uniref:Fe-S oxidoreductase n=1 Tax=Streptosporangium pseudovulgare TaxID=35765 RepID=A0ABQ2RIW7_9ACTN|nr:(Fe-S)-binding protein [Streptosporangium pseudovulgare]GGQ30391.1 Fe-S oxidoreductase [Streptosporangium pseudovulgare]